jgi:hypothetical protein
VPRPKGRISLHIIGVCWLVRDHLLLREIGPRGIIFINMCCYSCYHGRLMLLMDFGLFGLIFMTLCLLL